MTHFIQANSEAKFESNWAIFTYFLTNGNPLVCWVKSPSPLPGCFTAKWSSGSYIAGCFPMRVVSRQEQESRCWFWDPLTIFHIWVQMHFWPTLVVGLLTQPTAHTNSIMHLLWVTRSIKCKIVNFSTLSFFKFPLEHFFLLVFCIKWYVSMNHHKAWVLVGLFT